MRSAAACSISRPLPGPVANDSVAPAAPAAGGVDFSAAAAQRAAAARGRRPGRRARVAVFAAECTTTVAAAKAGGRPRSSRRSFVDHVEHARPRSVEGAAHPDGCGGSSRWLGCCSRCDMGAGRSFALVGAVAAVAPPWHCKTLRSARESGCDSRKAETIRSQTLAKHDVLQVVPFSLQVNHPQYFQPLRNTCPQLKASTGVQCVVYVSTTMEQVDNCSRYTRCVPRGLLPTKKREKQHSLR